MSSSVSVKSDCSKGGGPDFSGEPSRAKRYLMCFLFVFTQTVSESLSVNNYHKPIVHKFISVVFLFAKKFYKMFW